VVDKNGEPLLMFRGDDANKTFFEKVESPYNKYGNGIYVTRDYATALTAAQWYKENATVYPVFVQSLQLKSFPKIDNSRPNSAFIKEVRASK
jgi:hypothetical protein